MLPLQPRPLLPRWGVEFDLEPPALPFSGELRGKERDMEKPEGPTGVPLGPTAKWLMKHQRCEDEGKEEWDGGGISRSLFSICGDNIEKGIIAGSLTYSPPPLLGL